METITNYLDSMFRGLPLTEKVVKAKSELLQMMEDKYAEMIRSGKTENEAVGEVIQNFGNLEDLAEDLGIMDILHQTKYSEIQRRKLSFEEVSGFLNKKRLATIFKCLGIALCIICVVFPILGEAYHLNDAVGVTFMFASIAAGVILMCLAHAQMEEWKYVSEEPCSIDSVSIVYLKDKIREFTPTYSVMSSVGVILCIMCFIPAVIFDELGGGFYDDLGGAFLFVFVAAGVFLIVYAKSMKKTYSNLLGTNERVDFAEKKEESKIENKTVRVILSVYWSVVTCIYLCVSFLTFAWHLTWLIWPVAASVYTIIKAIYTVNKDEKKEEKTAYEGNE